MSSLDTQLHAALSQALGGVKYDGLRARAAAMSARFRAERVDDTTLGMADRLDCLAYAVFRMPATFHAIRAALRAADAHVGAFGTQLDLGGGTGAAAWAAADVWPGISIEIVERQPPAIELGRRLLATSNEPHNPAGADGHRDRPRGARSHPSGGLQRWTAADLRSWTPDRHVDLITIAYVLNELSEATRRRLITLASAAADTVVIVEPGTPRGFQRILDVRRHLIDLGLTVAAPCPHHDACPLTTTDWCHFAVRLPRTELHRLAKTGTRNFEDEKFAYLVATRRPVRAAANRVVARPVRPKGQVVLDLCTADGARQRLVVPRSSGQYRAARDAVWGETWGSGQRS
ncbi:rRNA methyltransferase [Kribbella turkmenica]|uniref:rRNA methyltransferase n=1 Tax=Kribbella turkmenica TaxID=2530375 RepID=A0A4R4XFV8_9ACTN|nr:small ribosomal subunit Rsm22 family protein [Kribbella turkmenica]TDD29584.1 rRNA methyltransferase [Kribbella turkmenica]